MTEQPVVFGAVDLSESGSDRDQSENQEEQEGSEQGASAESSPAVSEVASPISPRGPAPVSAPPSVPAPASAASPPKAPSVLFKGPLRDLVNLADSASGEAQPNPRPIAKAGKSSAWDKKAPLPTSSSSAEEFPAIPGAKAPRELHLSRAW